MSVRTRLAGILAAVMLLPVLVAGAIAGLIAPHQQNQAARDLVTQAATSLASIETEICRGLGDSATALALDARGGDVQMAVDDAVNAAARQLRHGDPRVDRAGSGRRGADATRTATRPRPPSSAGSPAPTAGSCPGTLPGPRRERQRAARHRARAPTTTAVVGIVLDANQLAALRDRIGLRDTEPDRRRPSLPIGRARSPRRRSRRRLSSTRPCDKGPRRRTSAPRTP